MLEESIEELTKLMIKANFEKDFKKENKRLKNEQRILLDILLERKKI